MNYGVNFDVLISLLIVALVLGSFILSRRDAAAQGRANPVGTANLQTDVNGLKNRMTRMEADIKNIQADLDMAPTKADIAKLEERIAGVAGHVESIDQAVVRIEQFLIQGGPVAQAAAPRTTRRRK